MPRGGQLGRQWRLLQFLGRADGVAVEDAGRELGCAVRTVWRDLDLLPEVDVGIRAIGAKLQLGAGEYLDEIHRAMAESRTLRMRYYSLSRDAETDRLADPYHVTLVSGGLYLLGHCHLRREVRIFAVERIRAVHTLRETFAAPADQRVPSGRNCAALAMHLYGPSAGRITPGESLLKVESRRPSAAHLRDPRFQFVPR